MALGLVFNNSLNGMDERVHASCVSSRGALGERAGSACMAATPRMMAEACIRGALGLGLLPSSTWSGGRLRTSSLTDGSPRIFPFYHTVFFPFSVPCSSLLGTGCVDNTLSINELFTKGAFKAWSM